MHTHVSFWKGGQTLMFDDNGYAKLSEMAIHYIGGLLKHAPTILAFAAPTTNSYRRLVPGYEAPIYLAYSGRNRSACWTWIPDLLPLKKNLSSPLYLKLRITPAECNL
jgi:glutamine synthetase